jgi:hypothetical protein
MPRTKGRPPATTSTGLVHVHILMPPALHQAVQRRRGLTSKSAFIISILAAALDLDAATFRIGPKNLLAD